MGYRVEDAGREKVDFDLMAILQAYDDLASGRTRVMRESWLGLPDESNLRPMQRTGLDVLPENPNAYPEELVLVEGLRRTLDDLRPKYLQEVRAEWSSRYLHVQLRHSDGVTDLDLWYGDGYTGIVCPHLDYKGWMEPNLLFLVLSAAMTGRLVEVEHYRLGRLVGTHYDIEGETRTTIRRPERGLIGRRKGWLGALLGRVPGLPEQDKRTSLSFDRTPAALPSR